jgi:hypothetical protein
LCTDGESFGFCEQGFVFNGVDAQLSRQLDAFVAQFSNTYAKSDVATRRALLGVSTLSEDRAQRQALTPFVSTSTAPAA